MNGLTNLGYSRIYGDMFCVLCMMSKKDDPDRIESCEALTQSTGSACYIFNAIWAMQQ